MQFEAYPTKTRGLGNVVVPKNIMDYVTGDSILTESTEEYDGWKICDMIISHSPVSIRVDKTEFNYGTDATIMQISFFRKSSSGWVPYPNAQAELFITGLERQHIQADSGGVAYFDVGSVIKGAYLDFYVFHVSTSAADAKWFHGWLILNIKSTYTQNNSKLTFKVGDDPLSDVKVTLKNNLGEIKEYYLSDDKGEVDMSAEYSEGDTFKITKEGYFFIKED